MFLHISTYKTLIIFISIHVYHILISIQVYHILPLFSSTFLWRRWVSPSFPTYAHTSPSSSSHRVYCTRTNVGPVHPSWPDLFSYIFSTTKHSLYPKKYSSSVYGCGCDYSSKMMVLAMEHSMYYSIHELIVHVWIYLDGCKFVGEWCGRWWRDGVCECWLVVFLVFGFRFGVVLFWFRSNPSIKL